MNSSSCRNDILLRNMIYGFRRMIHLLRKHDIISVPSYATGIYHPPQVDIISKIYHPFRQERISLKNDKFLSKLVVFHGGEGGIRTLEPLLMVTRFPIVRARPTTRLLHIGRRPLYNDFGKKSSIFFSFYKFSQEVRFFRLSYPEASSAI